MDLSDSRAPNSGTCVGILRRFLIAPTPKRCVRLAVHGISGKWGFGRRVRWVWHAPPLDLHRGNHSIRTGVHFRAIAESGPLPGGATPACAFITCRKKSRSSSPIKEQHRSEEHTSEL